MLFAEKFKNEQNVDFQRHTSWLMSESMLEIRSDKKLINFTARPAGYVPELTLEMFLKKLQKVPSHIEGLIVVGF